MHWTEINGWLFDNEGEELAELAQYLKVLEIGSYQGRSTMAMAPFCERITCVDHFRGSRDDRLGEQDAIKVQGEFYNNTDSHAHKIDLHAIPMRQFIRNYNACTWNMIFYDAGHSAEDVKVFIDWIVDSEYDGILCVHDYGKPDEFPGTQSVMDNFKGDIPFKLVGSLLIMNERQTSIATYNEGI